MFWGDTKETLSVLPEARALSLSLLSLGRCGSGHGLPGCHAEEPLQTLTATVVAVRGQFRMNSSEFRKNTRYRGDEGWERT